MATNIPTWETPPSSVVETLERVKELLSDRKRWTKGAYAKTSRGYKTDSPWDDAVKFCMMGAIGRVGGGYEHEVFTAVGRVIKRVRPRSSVGIAEFNDSSRTSHDDVLAVIDKAIEEEKASV